MTAARNTAANKVTFELVRASLLSAAVEMGGVLKRSSYSPIIREMDDFSCAIFRPDGDLVAQADFIPAQLGAMSLVVKSLIQRWGDAVRPGDAYLANHPYMGAMHTPDLNVIMPIFISGRLSGWTGTAAHHIDVGGVRPGTEGFDLGDIYAEGLLLPGVRLYVGGEENPDVVAMIAAMVRDPQSTLSDLRAQRAACLLGIRRIEELVSHYGRDVVLKSFDDILDSVERAARAALHDLPDGEAEAEGFLDDDGIGGAPVRVHARLTKTDERLTVDFSGTSAQVGGAMNVPWASTRAAVVYVLRAMTDPGMTTNDGVLRVLDIICPEGTLLNPRPPAAVSVRHNTCQRVADTLVRAAARLWPDHAIASSTVGFFAMNLESRSPRTGAQSVMAEVVGGGTGANRRGDGLDGVDTYLANVGLMPVEVAETDYSVRILRTELIPGSQGVGQYNGGLGIRREYQILDRAARVTMYSEQTDPRFAPSGVAGGTSAVPSCVTLRGPDGEPVPIPSKVTMVLEPGSIVRIETSGGGGYGDPKRRDPTQRAQDEVDGRLRDVL
jgi:N-methylhydantoinase B